MPSDDLRDRQKLGNDVLDTWKNSGTPRFEEAARLIQIVEQPPYTGGVCGALKQGTAGGNEPADCNWPFCGCDPRASKLVETLLECGWTAPKPQKAGRPTLDEYAMDLLPRLARRGTCRRRQTSAIVMDDHGYLLGTGYNGNAASLPHCIDSPCPGVNDATGDNRRCEAIHAEYNAIMQAGSRLPQATRLYTLASPCLNCAKLILCTSIKEVLFLDFYIGDMAGVTLLLKAGRQCFRLLTDGVRQTLGLDPEGAIQSIR